MTNKQLKEHLNLDVTSKKESLKDKALAYLKTKSLTETDKYNLMMYKEHISHLTT